MKDLNIKSILGPVADALKRYNLTIFIVIMVGGLAASVIMLNNIVVHSSDTTGLTPKATNITFDQSTIDRINQLHPSSDPGPPFVAPAGRINPFSE